MRATRAFWTMLGIAILILALSFGYSECVKTCAEHPASHFCEDM